MNPIKDKWASKLAFLTSQVSLAKEEKKTATKAMNSTIKELEAEAQKIATAMESGDYSNLKED